MTPRPRVECPGCGKKMAKGSRLCGACRRRAIGVGVEAIVATKGKEKPNRLTDGQRRAFYGKANDLDELFNEQPGTFKAHALSEASKQFHRSIESVNDLSEAEASWVLDKMTEDLNAATLSLSG
jgi:hypothetical protein